MNTERIEKFVNALACDLEEGGFRQVSGTTLRRTLATAVSAALPLLEAGNPVSSPAGQGDDLLPCPFCGNNAEFVPYKNNGLTVKCKSMGCIQRHQRTLRYGIEWLRASMTEHWNARALAARQPGAQETVDVEAALAAGDPNWQAQCRPNLRGNERLFFAVRDIAEMRAMLAGEKKPLPGSGLAVVRVNPNAPSVVPYQCAHRLLGDAYQAGENGGGFCDQAEELFVAMTAHAKRDRMAVVYAAPPAQGIDLGPFRPFVQAERAHLSGRIERCDAIGSADRLEALQAKARECDRLLALIDGQRDAAPGVGQ